METINNQATGGGEQEIPDKFIDKHLDQIHFLKALYGHTPAYIECKKGDRGAFEVGKRWLQPLNVKIGVEVALRRRHFEILQWFEETNCSPESLETLREFLFSTNSK